MPWGNFKLAELNLDLKNARTGVQSDQRAAIHALIADQKQKLVNLAIDLLKFGPSPGEPIWTTPDPNEPGRQIVLEGNRRVCALKLLENPRLADNSEVSTAFVQLAKEFSEKPIRSLDAALFVSRESAQPFIDRRHMGAASGVGLQRWRSLAKERAQPGWSGRVRRSLLTLDYLDDDTEEFGEVGAVIEAKSTTFDRVLNHPAMKTVLGIGIDPKTKSISFESGDEIAGRRLLRDLIGEMAKPDFPFSDIRDKGDRERFIGRFSDRALKAPNGVAPIIRALAPPPPKTTARRPTEKTRSTLAPKSGIRVLAKVTGTRLNRIYRECREINLVGNENAAALLLRVFIELSTDFFLLDMEIPLTPALIKKQKADWADLGVTLSDKITAVMTEIDKTSRTKQQLKSARVALANRHRNGSIDTLHAYFHNLDMNPDVPGLRDAWDTWENYLALIHSARS